MRRRQVFVEVRKGVGRTVYAPAPSLASASQIHGRQWKVLERIVVPEALLYVEM